ncbi:MAG: cation transporter [Oscillospiraceae bacterium]|nr:cation transporter [Oscillospiraceae bacterium]MCI9363601.1 cation transporter [Oscillospiraceae bacterium]RKJ55002.1 cation transporter [bacterium 1XD42-8]RKJ64122.1 cation transporter [bacterium 1XD42-1]
MVNFLIRLFIPDSQKINDPVVRGRYGILAGGMGILLNLCLFCSKFFAGFFTGSIAITADAFNNLSDAGSSVVTLAGFKMASMPADREHPFGHGRLEYLSGLAISAAILLVGLELGKSSVEKIIHPEAVRMGILPMVILICSILVKLWMAYFNRSLGKRISSSAMMATAADSLTDAAATSAVLVGMAVGHLSGRLIDGYIGLLVAAFILYSGFTTARDSLSPLLGQAPDKEFVASIQQAAMAHPEILGIHDLIVHDYGPGRRIISFHAEVPSNRDILETHDVIDHLEMELRERFQCDVTVHMDPIVIDNAVINALRSQVTKVVKGIDPHLTIHDFRMVDGPTHANLIFDVMAPYQFRMSDSELIETVQQKIKALDPRYFAVVQIDKE